MRGAGFSTVAKFARDIHRELARHLASKEVSFRGSLAEDTHDEYSDVDILAEVHSPLDQRFWAALEHRLMDLYGPAIVRYDSTTRKRPPPRTRASPSTSFPSSGAST